MTKKKDKWYWWWFKSQSDLFIPDRWRSRFSFERVTFSPSQKGHQQNCQGVFLLKGFFVVFSRLIVEEFWIFKAYCYFFHSKSPLFPNSWGSHFCDVHNKLRKNPVWWNMNVIYSKSKLDAFQVIYVWYFRLFPHLVTVTAVTTRIIPFLVGDPEPKPSFATGILGGGTTQLILYTRWAPVLGSLFLSPLQKQVFHWGSLTPK